MRYRTLDSTTSHYSQRHVTVGRPASQVQRVVVSVDALGSGLLQRSCQRPPVLPSAAFIACSDDRVPQASPFPCLPRTEIPTSQSKSQPRTRSLRCRMNYLYDRRTLAATPRPNRNQKFLIVTRAPHLTPHQSFERTNKNAEAPHFAGPLIFTSRPPSPGRLIAILLTTSSITTSP